ncbi:hypothetical protein Nepgr_033995 [Nepenthes gracilis]|uniref:Uncharacterized protein n=1 Tax=Nepenthes gracilis TaxID=150966 RepID=A0AAD3TMW3_NEPGR|nr:hypothetical protein Nepgr_033995 [Nepenthes gracilis]
MPSRVVSSFSPRAGRQSPLIVVNVVYRMIVYALVQLASLKVPLPPPPQSLPLPSESRWCLTPGPTFLPPFSGSRWGFSRLEEGSGGLIPLSAGGLPAPEAKARPTVDGMMLPGDRWWGYCLLGPGVRLSLGPSSEPAQSTR